MRVALALALLALALLDPYERERLALLRAALLPRPPPLELAAAATTADGVVGAVAPGVAAPVLPREADRPRPLAPPPLLRLPLRLRLSRPALVLPSPPLPPAPLPALLRWLLWLLESASYMEYVKKVGCSTALVLPLALPLLLWLWPWPCLWLR